MLSRDVAGEGVRRAEVHVTGASGLVEDVVAHTTSGVCLNYDSGPGAVGSPHLQRERSARLVELMDLGDRLTSSALVTTSRPDAVKGTLALLVGRCRRRPPAGAVGSRCLAREGCDLVVHRLAVAVLALVSGDLVKVGFRETIEAVYDLVRC